MRYTITSNNKTEHLYAVHGLDFLLVLWDMDNYLRQQIKYNPNRLNGDKLDALEMARDELRKIMAEYGVSLEMLE